MRILICDDDALIREQLVAYINEYFERSGIPCPEIACFPDGKSLLDDPGEKDILFLDIEMPGFDGIFVGNELKKEAGDVIIFVVSAYSTYLDDAMRFNVFRYLSKPLEKQRLFRNFKDALNLYHNRTIRLPLETREGVHTLPAAHIIAVETQRRKVIVHATERDFESVHNMQYWKELLPDNVFFQPHRSFLVNLAHVRDLDHTSILLTGDVRAYLTKRKFGAFKTAYLLYLESTR